MLGVRQMLENLFVLTGMPLDTLLQVAAIQRNVPATIKTLEPEGASALFGGQV